jgi:hypothetical protein
MKRDTIALPGIYRAEFKIQMHWMQPITGAISLRLLWTRLGEWDRENGARWESAQGRVQARG